MNIPTNFQAKSSQRNAAAAMINRINNMKSIDRTKLYQHFVELSAIAAQNLPAGQDLSIFDDIAAIIFDE